VSVIKILSEMLVDVKKGRAGAALSRDPSDWSVFARQQERRHAAVGLGDYPELVVAEPLARLAVINRIGGQDAETGLYRLVGRGSRLAIFG
jgi:hypothetical protein